MPKFETIKVGDVLYDCRYERAGNTTMKRLSCWKVVVKEIYPEKGSALCSWNGNPPRMYYRAALQRLRRSPAKPKSAMRRPIESCN